jgi:hypothetical protein
LIYDDHPIEGLEKSPADEGALCRNCGFYPVSVRAPGYCSFDCFEESDDS